MEYVGRNLKNYIRKEPVIFTLMMVCVVASVTVMFFAFGLYHHLEQKKMDTKLGQTDLLIGFYGKEGQMVTKGEVVEACKDLPKEILDHCYFSASARTRDADKVDDESVTLIALHFSVRNGKISVADIGERLKKQKYIIEGDWFTASQVENGDLVCLAFDPSITIIYQDEKSAAYGKQFEPNQNGKYVVDGKEYTCIGYQDGVYVPLVPITTLEDDIVITEAGVFFDKVITREQYDAVKETFEKHLGDAVSIAPLAIPDLDGTEFYTTLTIACACMAVLSGVVLAMLYEYILLQRRRQLTIFRLCGMSLAKVKGMYIAECMLITLVSMVIAAVFFRVGILPWAERIYEYIAKSYTWKSCGILGCIYIGITMVVLSVMLRIKLPDNVFAAYCE